MFVTNDDLLYKKMQTLSNHGRAADQTKQFWPDMVGFKYKMSNIQAAIGCAQMERVDELIAKKRRIFKHYEKMLSTLPLTMNPEHEGTVNGYWMPSIVVNEDVSFDRTLLINEFNKNNIDGRVFFWPLTQLPMFTQQPEHRVSYSIYQRAINLPSYHDISEEELDRVIHTIFKLIEKKAIAYGR
jgi:perosamine synthetase